MSLIEDIRDEEGFRQFPYRCTEGKLSIGYGFNLDDVGLSREEADLVLVYRVERLTSQVKSSLYKLDIDDKAWEILYHMSYQLGLNGLLEFKKMIEALEDQDYKKASEEMLRSLWYKQTPNRAKRLSDKMYKIN